jgi:hypothetical protein
LQKKIFEFFVLIIIFFLLLKESLLRDNRLNSFSRECVRFFLSNWKIVKGSYFDYSLDRGSTGGTRRIYTVQVDKGTARGAQDPSSRNIPIAQPSHATIDPTVFNRTTEEALSMVRQNMDVSEIFFC